MNETTAVTVSAESALDTLHRKATYLVRSGLLPKAINTPEKAITMMLLAEELGIGPMAAINNINVIDGKPTVSAQLALALFYRTGLCETCTIVGDSKSCTVTLKRKGQEAHAETFTMDDAVRMGLSTKDNWRKQPAVMLRWRTVAACLRVVAPDILQGVYTPDEMGSEAPGRRMKVLDVDTGEVLLDDTEYAATPDITDGEYTEKEESTPEETLAAWNNLDAILKKVKE